MDYLLNICIAILFYSCISQILSVYLHYTKRINFSSLALAGITMYTISLLPNPVLPLVLPIIILVALIFSLYLQQIQEKYFMICTLVLGLLSYQVFVNLESLTNGMQGVFLLPTTPIPTLYVLTIFIITALILDNLESHFTKIKLANVLKLISDNQKIVKMYGHNTKLVSIFFFTATSVLFVIVCIPYFFHLNYIHPTSFGLSEIFVILTISMLANSPKLVQNLYAAAFIVLIPEIFSFLPALKIFGPELKQLFSACVMLYIVYAKNN